MTECERVDAEYRRKMEKAIKVEFPIGRRVAWEHGIHQQFGEVVRHGYFTNVRVLNAGTGRERWTTVLALTPLGSGR